MDEDRLQKFALLCIRPHDLIIEGGPPISSWETYYALKIIDRVPKGFFDKLLDRLEVVKDPFELYACMSQLEICFYKLGWAGPYETRVDQSGRQHYVRRIGIEYSIHDGPDCRGFFVRSPWNPNVDEPY